MTSARVWLTSPCAHFRPTFQGERHSHASEQIINCAAKCLQFASFVVHTSPPASLRLGAPLICAAAGEDRDGSDGGSWIDPYDTSADEADLAVAGINIKLTGATAPDPEDYRYMETPSLRTLRRFGLAPPPVALDTGLVDLGY